jgi:hypothetical protein
MFGYIKHVELEVTLEAVRPFPEVVEQGGAQANEAVEVAESGGRFWRWWISLYCPNSRPTTAGL